MYPSRKTDNPNAASPLPPLSAMGWLLIARNRPDHHHTGRPEDLAPPLPLAPNAAEPRCRAWLQLRGLFAFTHSPTGRHRLLTMRSGKA